MSPSRAAQTASWVKELIAAVSHTLENEVSRRQEFTASGWLGLTAGRLPH